MRKPKKPTLKKYPKKPKMGKKPKSTASVDVWERYNKREEEKLKNWKDRCKEVDKENKKKEDDYKKTLKQIEDDKRKKEALKKKASSLAGTYRNAY